jgi:hypothetical protein
MQMNLQLHHFVSDITGATGVRIVRAFVAGERDLVRLAALRDQRCKASAETIRQALVGNDREEHIFALKQAVELSSAWRGATRSLVQSAFVPNAPFQQSGISTAPLGGGHGGTHRDRVGSLLSRLAGRVGKAKAVTATARKIAVLFCNTLRQGMGYADLGASYYQDRYRQRVLANPGPSRSGTPSN